MSALWCEDTDDDALLECERAGDVDADNLAATPIISVVVPTCRRPQMLERCLASLLAQNLAPEQYEIVVVDDAGLEETRAQVQSCVARHSARGPALRYIAAGARQGPAAARNVGWRAARGAIIAFTDDDCVPEPGWLRAGLEALDGGAAGVWGRLILPLPPDPTDYELNAARLAHAEFVTANCFYRRDVLRREGGFDERFTAAWREDSDLYFRLRARREVLVHAAQAVVVHPIRPAPWGVSLHQQRKSQFNALLYKKHPELYRKRIQASPPWRYYAIVSMLLGACLALLAGHFEHAALSGAIWSALTLRFTWVRLRGTSHAALHVAEMLVTSALIPLLAVFWRIYGAVKYRVWFL